MGPGCFLGQYVMGKSFDMQGVELDAVTHLALSFLFSR